MQTTYTTHDNRSRIDRFMDEHPKAGAVACGLFFLAMNVLGAIIDGGM